MTMDREIKIVIQDFHLHQGLTKGYLDAAIQTALEPLIERINTMEANFERELQEMKAAVTPAVAAMLATVPVMESASIAIPSLRDALDAALTAMQNAGASTAELQTASGELDALQQTLAPAALALSEATTKLNAALNPPQPPGS